MLQIDPNWFFVQLVEFSVQICAAILAGVFTALFAIYFSRWRDRKKRINALGERLAAELAIFHMACGTLVEKTGRGPDSLRIIQELAIKTAQSLMGAYQLYPEVKDALPWESMVDLAQELIHLAVKGWGDAEGTEWYIQKVNALKSQTQRVAEAL